MRVFGELNCVFGKREYLSFDNTRTSKKIKIEKPIIAMIKEKAYYRMIENSCISNPVSVRNPGHKFEIATEMLKNIYEYHVILYIRQLDSIDIEGENSSSNEHLDRCDLRSIFLTSVDLINQESLFFKNDERIRKKP